MELVKGQVVTSRKGRDVTKTYVVLAHQGQRVLLCDGDARPLQDPKKKNPQHLQPTGTVLPQGEMDTDQKLRAALKAYEQSRGRQSLKGG